MPGVAVGSSSGPTTEQGQDEVDSPDVPQASSHKPAEKVNVAKEDIIEIVPSAPAEVKDVNLDDVGCWPSPMTDEVRTLLVRRGSDSVQHIDSKFADVVRSGTSTKGGTRKLTKEWFYKPLSNGEKVLRTWLVYSPLKQSLYCFSCKLFGNSGSNFASEEGFNKWWKLNPRIGDHENNLGHEQSFLKWKELEVRLNCKATIDQKQQEVFESEEKKWRDVLYRLLNIIQFLAKQNLAFRGHREDIRGDDSGNRGNFLELVHLLAKYDPLLMEHLTKIKLGARVSVSYLSPETQNEFINLLGQQVRSTIIRRIQKAKYYCVIFDSTPDISHNDQMSQVLRYVHIEGEKVAVVESFIDFFQPKGKNAEDLSNDIIAKITSDGLDIQNLRGQAYDNAATMSGIHNGVQARIKALNPKALFVACTNHSLNLAGVHAASESVNSVTFFGILEKLFAFFSASTVRWNALVAVTGQAVKRVTETRWSARHVAVKMLKNKFEGVLEVLEQLTDSSQTSETRSGASLLLTAMQSFNFLTFLGFWAAVLPEVDDAQIYLQQRGLSVDKCAQKLCALKTLLVESRDRLVQEAIDFAKTLCEKLGIELKTRRICRKKRMHGDESSADAALSHEQEIRREVFASLDKIIQEMTTRFQQIQEISDKFGFLMPAKLLDSKFECDLSHVLEDIDKDEFQMERKRLQQFIACSESEEDISGKGPLELLQFIQKLNLGISVPNIVILIRIYLTLAISVASCERSFSKLKLIKNYLRSTMSSARLSNLAILSIEQELAANIDFDKVISDFAAHKARRIRL